MVLGDWALHFCAMGGIELVVDGITRAGTAQIVVTCQYVRRSRPSLSSSFLLETNAGLLRADR